MPDSSRRSRQLKDFVTRNKARVATRNMAMSRQKKLDKMDVIQLAREKPKPEFRFGRDGRRTLSFQTQGSGDRIRRAIVQATYPFHGERAKDCADGSQWYRQDNAAAQYLG